MDSTERQRRHDEAWQKETLDGLARILDVLHDISDGIRRLVEVGEVAKPIAAPAETAKQQLLSVNDTAELLGVSPSAIRGLRAAGNAPTVTKLGSRVFFQLADIEEWLQRQRQDSGDTTRPWKGAYLPGRIGSQLPRSSEPTKREFCEGSHSEPMAASKYSGRAVCRVCRDDVLVNRDGRLRKHYPRWW